MYIILYVAISGLKKPIPAVVLFPLTVMFVLFFSDERDAIQKKTFTKWVNKHLKKVK